MRIKFNKEIEFYLKKIFFSQKYLLKRRLERSIKNNEENELKLVKDFILPGTDSIDIGVYRGVYSFQMSKFSKTVHAFEPNPIIYEDLQKNLLKITKNIPEYNTIIAFGGLHHSPNFKKIILNTEFAISHVCPKYNLENLDKNMIKQAIEKYEPRADLQNVTVHAREEENAYQIIITYIPDNDVLETNLEVYLERT